MASVFAMEFSVQDKDPHHLPCGFLWLPNLPTRKPQASQLPLSLKKPLYGCF